MLTHSILKKHAASRKKVTVHTSYDYSYEGYLLDVGDEWCLIQCVADFVRDGYVCLRNADIVKIHESSAFYRKMNLREGLVPEEQNPFELDLNSTKNLIKAANAHCKLFMVDFFYETPQCLYLGKVHRLMKTKALFWKMYTSGRWGSIPGEAEYEDVSSVRFLNRYCEVYAKYAPTLKPPSISKTARTG